MSHAITPSPPRAGLHLPRVGAALSLFRDPTEFFLRSRARHGETFVLDVFGRSLLCIFSAAGIRELWALPEKTASKGLADFEMLRHKVPDDLFAGRRILPHDLFSRDDMGQIAGFREGYVNVAEIEFAGLQVVGNYATGMGRFGDLAINLNYLFTEQHLETPGSGNTLRLDGEVGESTHRVTLGVTWDIGNWSWYNQIRWLDSAVFNNADDEFTRDVKGVDDWLVVNSSLFYRFNDNFDMQLTVDNLFDTDPPFAGNAAYGGILAYYSGILGRYARLRARLTF